MLKGYRIVGRRYRTRVGEIDLIARRGNVVRIIEVKARAKLEQAMDAVNALTRRRIEVAADQWLARQPDHAVLSPRFDLVAILPWRWPVHIPAVFTI